MTDQRCAARCGRPARGGIICPACGNRLRTDLHHVAALRAELETALSRQTAMGRGVGGRSCETPMPYGVPASDALRRLDKALADTTRNVDPFGLAFDGCADAAYLRDHLHRTHDMAKAAYRRITEAVTKARDVIDRPPDRWYAGTCGNDEHRDQACTTELYVEAGTAYVDCPGCRTRWDVQARRDILIVAVRERLAYAALLERALDQIDVRITAATVRQWARRKRITAVDVDDKGRPLYRVGDVLDIVAEEERRVAEIMLT